MTAAAHQKITARHLQRTAYLYVRQSTVRQVVENTESTQRQYALRQRAVALGWPFEQVVVIDTDQGHSGAAAADRAGFQRLVTEVSMGRAGIVLGLEVSRLARNSTDWHRLLEICALAGTLILDEDGIYDPCDFNDRLLLGLKGTMSEAELHVLRARLRGGILNKARRGELKSALPVGFVYDASDRVILDPDQQVQHSIHHLFATFRRTGAARATVKIFRDQQLRFPRRVRTGPHRGKLVWGPLSHWRVLQVLHNPRYAGAFFFGRCRTRRQPDGRTVVERPPRDQWHALLPDRHPGYISWPEYEENQRRLREAAHAYGTERRKSPPREGPALLQGLVVCGVCGTRMTVRYHTRRGTLVPTYVCQRKAIQTAVPTCQSICGAGIDEAMGALLIETVTPTALEVALQVQQELQRRFDDADRLRRQHVERTRYEAELAQRRYMQVDPANRLVADALEAEWNDKLRLLAEAQEQYEQRRATDTYVVSDAERHRILALATDFPRLWRAPSTPQRERKRMVRLLIEDVTLVQGKTITVHVRFKGGKNHTFTVRRPALRWQLRQTDPSVVREIDRLLDQYTEGEIAAQLNERGLTSGDGKAFHPAMVHRLRRDYHLKSRYQRLRDRGMLTATEMARQLHVCTRTIRHWRDHGLVRGHRYNTKRECLYEPPGDHPPVKAMGRKLSKRRDYAASVSNGTKEVQCGE